MYAMSEINVATQLFSSLLMWTAVATTYVGTALVFNKAGENWWKGLIPFYNIWVETKIGQSPPSWFWLYLGVSFVAGFPAGIGIVLISISQFEHNAALMAIGIIMVLLTVALAIATLALYGRILYNLVQCFGKGLGFTLGLLFLGPIFWLILGLDDSQYRPRPEPMYPPYGTATMSGIQGPGPYGQVPDPHVQQEMPAAGTFPQQPQQVMPENSGRLSPGAVAGYTLLIIAPLALCCMAMEFFTLTI
ncbi:MAG: DUF5684 domain-containing protein [Coriobacteriia bacterium]|nr:DUF5684 domain-containing protein [Coriobacteriia bacterium]